MVAGARWRSSRFRNQLTTVLLKARRGSGLYQATNSLMLRPYSKGLTVDGGGNLFVANSTVDEIRMEQPAFG